MPATYEPIATTTLGSAASSITFSSIPGTYTDLRIVLMGLSADSGRTILAQYNGDTGNNYSNTILYGDGTTAASTRLTTEFQYAIMSGSTSTTIPSLATLDIFGYTRSTFKTALAQVSTDFNGSGRVDMAVTLWRSTSAITSVSFSLSAAVNYATGTTATLYGIKAA